MKNNSPMFYSSALLWGKLGNCARELLKASGRSRRLLPELCGAGRIRATLPTARGFLSFVPE